MKQLIKAVIIALSIFGIIGGNLFAAESATKITLDKAETKSLDVRWDKVNDAYGYYIYYGMASGKENGYEFESEDLIEGTKTSLTNLKGNTLYFMSITAVDENGDEILKSDEFSFTTLKTQKLVLEGIAVVGLKTIELSFGSAIDDSKEKDFIVKSLPTGSELEIEKVVVNNTKILLSTKEEFVSQKKYGVVIISLFGIDGSTIISGIDGAVEFDAPDMSIFNVEEEEPVKDTTTTTTTTIQESTQNSDTEEEPVKDTSTISQESAQNSDTENEEDIELSSAGTGATASGTNTSNANLAGEEISDDDLSKNLNVAAAKKESLPTTGPEHVFIVFLAIILTGLIIHIRTRKV